MNVDGDRGAIDALTAVLADARAAEATIEVARCLAALRVLSTDVDPAWAEEERAARTALGVVCIPPVTFATV